MIDSAGFLEREAASDKTSSLRQTSPSLLFRLFTQNFCYRHKTELLSYSFPTWAEGHWEDVFVDSSTLVFKDRINFKTYSSKVRETTQCQNIKGQETVPLYWQNSDGFGLNHLHPPYVTHSWKALDNVLSYGSTLQLFELQAF